VTVGSLLFDQNWTAQAIAERFGVHSRTVYRAVALMRKLTLRPDSRLANIGGSSEAVATGKMRKAPELHAQSFTPEQIARMIDRAPSTVED
jgi:predicted DNA-binding transcriptional regulator YafY